MNPTVTTLANEAASLLPEPPAEDDAFGYLAWEELVVGTARRLAELADDGVLLEAGTVTLTPRTRRLDGPALLSLATLLTDPADPCAGERALWRAVTRSPNCAGEQARALVRADRSSAGHGPANRRAYGRRRTLLAVVKH